MNPLKILILFLFLACAECGFAAAAPAKILVLGDSLSAGYGIRIEQGWVHLLQQQLRQKSDAQVVNASVSGESSSGGRARLPALLLQHQPSIVILELGGNDGMRGQPLSMLEENLQAMLDAAQKAGAQVLLAGMQIHGNYGERYRRQFHEIYLRIAGKNKVPLIPFVLEGIPQHAELMQADRMHPTAEAQTAILQNVMPYLTPMLKAKRGLAAGKL